MDNQPRNPSITEEVTRFVKELAAVMRQQPQPISNNANQKENIAKTAEACVGSIGEKHMEEEIKKNEAVDESACGDKKKIKAEAEIESSLDPVAKAGEDEDKEEKEESKEGAADKEEEKNPVTFAEGPKDESKKKEINEKDFKEAEKLLNKVVASEVAEAAEGEDESEDIKNVKEAMSLLGMKVDKKDGEFESAENGEEFGMDFPLVEVEDGKEGEEGKKDEPMNLGASYSARFQKKATLADSTWFIKDAKTNQDFVSFDVKAAFGKNIDNDELRAKYASSKEFGRAVMASLAENKVDSALGVQSAVLQVVAHYSPSYPSAAMFKVNTKANFPKASGAGDTTTDAAVVPLKAAAGTEAPITKKAANADCGSIPTDAKVLPGACSVSPKVNTNVESSATPANNTKVESETDKKIIASYKKQLQALAEENNKLKIEAQLQEKTAIAKDCITLMVKAGLLRPNEQVRIAALKDGLSIEASNAKAIAASINEQTKYLLGMPTAQLEAYKQSIAHLQPAVTKTASVELPALHVKASAADSATAEENRLLSILEWDK